MNKIHELAIVSLEQTHQLRSSNPKNKTFQMGLKIVSLATACDIPKLKHKHLFIFNS